METPDTIDHEFDDTQPAPENVEPPREDPPPELVDDARSRVTGIADGPREDPPPELVDAMRRHFARKRADLQQQIQDIEDLLGFVDVSGELAVRVAKIERFLGVKA